MSFSSARWRWMLGAWLCVGLCGCLPPAGSPSDEEKEPYFQRGKELVNSLDYKGAIEAFEKALEVNPRNGRAHFELGLVYQRPEAPDLAAAIYHFERFLQLRPTSDQAELARQRINACNQDLARSVSASLNPLMRAMQRDLERATTTNAMLLAANSALAAENQELRKQLEAWRAYSARGPASPSPATNTRDEPARSGQGASVSRTSDIARPPVPSSGASRVSSSAAQRTYTVKSRETFASIARDQGVKLNAILAANPGIDPKKLKAGQTIVIPAR